MNNIGRVLDTVDITGTDQILLDLPTHRAHISETKRFLILLLGLFCMICTSFGSYSFNLVSDYFQEEYSLSQRDLSVITTAGAVVGNAVLPYSFIYDYFGPLPVAMLAIVVYPLGALLTAFSFEGIVNGSVVRLAVFYSMMNLGTTFYDMVCCMTVLSYFPTRRGAVVALLKTFVGLGSAITGRLYSGYFGNNISAFFYFQMVYAILCATLCCFFMKLPKYHMTVREEGTLTEQEKEERRASKAPYLLQNPPMYRFYIGFFLLGILIVFLPVVSALTTYLDLSFSYRLAFAVVTTVLPMGFSFIAFPWHKVLRLRGGESVPSFSQEEPAETARETEVDYIAPQYQTSFWNNLLSPHLWCLLWTQFVVLGAELMIMDNATYIFQALSQEKASQELRVMLTVLNGVGSACGRLLMSGFEAFTQNRPKEKRIPITLCIFFPSASVLLTLSLMLALPKAALPVPYFIGALGNGFLSAAALLVTRTLYAKDPAKHYNFLYLADALSAIVVNRFMYGEWYTKEAEKYGDLVCYHRSCVQTPLLIMVGLSSTAFISDIIVHFRYRAFCNAVLQHQTNSEDQSIEMEARHTDKLGEVQAQPVEKTPI